MQDLGRLAADLLLFYTQEFAFVELPDAFTTGSSIMPQKRNPDVFELVRGRTATAHGCLLEALGIFAKLPSGYQRDLQLLKFPAGEHLCGRPRQPAGARGRPELPRCLPARGAGIDRGSWMRPKTMPARSACAAW
jgi:hypothetical protein